MKATITTKVAPSVTSPDPVQKAAPMSDIFTPHHAAAHVPADDGAQSAVDLVCAYWAGLPRAGLAPDRAALDASALAAALPNLFIAELVTPRVARLRLVGHKVEDLMDMDLRGMPLTALFAGPARALLTDAIEQVGRGARVSLPLEGERGFGLPALTGQLVMLPLCDSTGQITRVLGVLDHTGGIGRKPRRFSIPARSVTALPPLATRPHASKAQRPMLRVINGGKR